MSSHYPRDIIYESDALVLVGVRDCTSLLLPEVDLHRVVGEPLRQANVFNAGGCAAAGISNTPSGSRETGWLVPRQFSAPLDLGSAVREARSQSPLGFKGLVIYNRLHGDRSSAPHRPAMSDSSYRRALLLSPGYLWLTKLRALETWEREGDWDEEEGGEGEIDFVKERTRCLFDLLLLFLQWRSRQQTRTRRNEKGKWKKLRQYRRKMEAAGAIPSSSALPASSVSVSPASSSSVSCEKVNEQEIQQDDDYEQTTYEAQREEAGREHEEERFLKLYPQYRADYEKLKAAFDIVCHIIDQHYFELNRRFPSMKEWARYGFRLGVYS